MTDELELEERLMAQEFASDLAKEERLEMFRTCRYCGKCEVTKLSANWWAPKFWCKEEKRYTTPKETCDKWEELEDE